MEISLREVNSELVIANVLWEVTGFHMPRTDLSKPGEIREGLFTHVFVKKQPAVENRIKSEYIAYASF